MKQQERWKDWIQNTSGRQNPLRWWWWPQFLISVTWYCEHNVYTTLIWLWKCCSSSNKCAPANLQLECTRSNAGISTVQTSIHILGEDLPDHTRWGGLPSLHPWQGRVCCHGLLNAHWSYKYNDAGKFLDYIESTLDEEISPCVRVYELEDVKKRADKTIDALIDHICQFACCALIGDESDAAVRFEVQHRLIHAIPDGDIEVWKELLKVSWDKGVSHLLGICHTYFAIKSGGAAICAGKTVNVVQKYHWPWKQLQKHPSQCQNCIC